MRVRIPPSPPNKVKGPVARQALLLYPVMGCSVLTLVRQGGRTAPLDSRRLPAGRAPGTARVNPDPAPNYKEPTSGSVFCFPDRLPAHATRGKPTLSPGADKATGLKTQSTAPPFAFQPCTSPPSPHRARWTSPSSSFSCPYDLPVLADTGRCLPVGEAPRIFAHRLDIVLKN